jgi:Family of unknown function (DUF5647)
MSIMDKVFIDKNVKFSLELDSYLAEHFELYESIPNGAVVVITLRSDKDFTNKSIGIARRSRSKRPIIEAEKSGREWTLRPLSATA